MIIARILSHKHSGFSWNGMDKKPPKLQRVHLKHTCLKSLWFMAFSSWLLQTSAFISLQVVSKDNERWLKRIFRALWEKESIDYFCPCFDHSFHDSPVGLHKLLLRSKQQFLLSLWTDICLSKCAEVSFHWLAQSRILRNIQHRTPIALFIKNSWFVTDKGSLDSQQR